VRVAATAPLPPSGHRLFAPIGPVSVVDVEDAPASVRDAEVLIVRAERIDETVLAHAADLRVIARTGAGLDNVDVAAATGRGVPVVYAPDAGTLPVAEGTIALILATAKRLGELGAVVREDRWRARYEVETIDLRGGTLGIVGLGRIGREVARLATAFGMKVIAHDPGRARRRTDGVELVGLPELASRSDVLTLHCDLNPDTRSLVDRAFLARMKMGAILVNVARGAVVESEDLLLEALDAGRLAAVGLDVFADEPPDDGHPLFADARVVCTPHTIGLTRAWNERVFGSLAADVAAVLAGRAPRHLANPEALARALAREPAG
jgi:phosphoglycerate dehydrogenase-like enzyme